MDITKCHGHDCPIKTGCFRHIAPSTEGWQSFFDPSPGKLEGKRWKCKYFWDADIYYGRHKRKT